MDLIWAKCLKSGQIFSKSGQKFIHLLLALSIVIFAIAISLLDSDMLLPRLLLCICLLCLDYLFLLQLTVPPSLGIALVQQNFSFFPLS